MEALALSAPARFAEVYEPLKEDMDATEYSFEMGEVTSEDDSAVAPFKATWKLEGLGDFSYDTALDLERKEGKWLVVWSPESVHPDLRSTRVSSEPAPGRRGASSWDSTARG